MKPSRGVLSTHGVIPACRSLDCMALFASTTEDLQQLFSVCAHFDPQDTYARTNPANNTGHQDLTIPATFKFAVPKTTQLEFFGNEAYRQAFEKAIH